MYIKKAVVFGIISVLLLCGAINQNSYGISSGYAAKSSATKSTVVTKTVTAVNINQMTVVELNISANVIKYLETGSDDALSKMSIVPIETPDVKTSDLKIVKPLYNKVYDPKTKKSTIKLNYTQVAYYAQLLPKNRTFELKSKECSFTISTVGTTQKFSGFIKGSYKEKPLILSASSYNKATKDPLILWLYDTFGRAYINKTIFEIEEPFELTPNKNQIVEQGQNFDYQVNRQIGTYYVDTLVTLSMDKVISIDQESLLKNCEYYNVSLPENMKFYTQFKEVHLYYNVKQLNLFSEEPNPYPEDEEALTPEGDDAKVVDTNAYILLSDLIKVPVKAHLGISEKDLLKNAVPVFNLYENEYNIKLFHTESQYGSIILIVPVQKETDLVMLISQDIDFIGVYEKDNWVVLKESSVE